MNGFAIVFSCTRMATVSACAHCHQRPGKLTCGGCRRATYCSVRCQTMDYEVGFHVDLCTRQPTWGAHHRHGSQDDRDDQDPDASALPHLFSASPQSQRRPLAYQAPPHVLAFGLDTHPTLSALELSTTGDREATFGWMMGGADSDGLVQLHRADSYGHGLLLVTRLERGVYVLLGEDDLGVTHPGDPPFRPAHRFVGAQRWAGNISPLVDYSRALGQILGRLHFRQGLDGFGFSVVGSDGRLYVQCDARQVRRLDLDQVEDTVDRLSFVLGRLAYVPNPRQADLFPAFADGYKEGAEGNRLAQTVLDGMLVYLE